MASSSPFKYTNKLQGRRILVLGGSTGIGFCVAEAAIEHGSLVTISSSSQTKLDRAVSRLQDHARAIGISPDNVSAKTCDLSNANTLDENIIQLLEFASKSGKLDHVAITAGDALTLSDYQSVTVDQLQKMNTVRVFGPIILAKHLPKYIHSSSQSSLTFTGGSASWRPTAAFALLAGVGANIEGLGRGLAVAMSPIRVNTVQPGAVRTEMFDFIPEENMSAVMESMKREGVLSKVGSPQEVAEAYIYCMKDTFATGGVVESNGGRLVGDTKGSFQFK